MPEACIARRPFGRDPASEFGLRARFEERHSTLSWRRCWVRMVVQSPPDSAKAGSHRVRTDCRQATMRGDDPTKPHSSRIPGRSEPSGRRRQLRDAFGVRPRAATGTLAAKPRHRVRRPDWARSSTALGARKHLTDARPSRSRAHQIARARRATLDSTFFSATPRRRLCIRTLSDLQPRNIGSQSLPMQAVPVSAAMR